MSDYYLPGFKAGGPIRTLANIVEHLGGEFSFHLITRDRDLGDMVSYSNLDDNLGHEQNIEISYLSPENLTIFSIKQRMQAATPDLIYLNSFFSIFFAIIPLFLRKLAQIPKIPIVLAPRGEFSLNALKIKAVEKRCYLFLAKLVGVCNTVVWQASGEHEAKDIRREFPGAQIVIAPDLPPFFHNVSSFKKINKLPGKIRIVFLSRISRMKNLIGALKTLGTISEGQIYFDIWGPIEDSLYWSECQQVIAGLPDNIAVQYCGVAQPDKVQAILAAYDLFFLPTLGENFGHVILEALASGTPVLISDRTQWKNLSSFHAGWEIPLDDQMRFTNVLQQFLAMNSYILGEWASGAQHYVATHCDLAYLKNETSQLFLSCLSPASSRSMR